MSAEIETLFHNLAMATISKDEARVHCFIGQLGEFDSSEIQRHAYLLNELSQEEREWLKYISEWEQGAREVKPQADLLRSMLEVIVRDRINADREASVALSILKENKLYTNSNLYNIQFDYQGAKLIEVHQVSFDEQGKFWWPQADPQIQKLLPKPLESELAILENSIREEGCRDRIIAWLTIEGNSVLLDGHYRLPILKRLYDQGIKIKFEIALYSLSSHFDAQAWVIDNALAKGHGLSNFERAKLIGRRYLLALEQSKYGDGLTRARIAKQTGVGETSVDNFAATVRAIDFLTKLLPDATEAIEAGVLNQSGLQRVFRAAQNRPEQIQQIYHDWDSYIKNEFPELAEQANQLVRSGKVLQKIAAKLKEEIPLPHVGAIKKLPKNIDEAVSAWSNALEQTGGAIPAADMLSESIEPQLKQDLDWEALLQASLKSTHPVRLGLAKIIAKLESPEKWAISILKILAKEIKD